MVRGARGKAVSHHITYTFVAPDGRILRTRLSRPAKPEPYAKSMATHILRDQLEISDKEFWACVTEGVKPHRAAKGKPIEVIPANLLQILKNDIHLSETELKKLSRADAIKLVTDYWSRETN